MHSISKKQTSRKFNTKSLKTTHTFATDHSHSNVSQRAGTDPCTTSGSTLFRCSDARRSSHTHRTGPSRFFCCCCSIHLELSTCWHPTVRKHSHFQTPLENPSIQTHLVLLCCIKRLCIFGPKGAIQIRYYYYLDKLWCYVCIRTFLYNMECRAFSLWPLF